VGWVQPVLWIFGVQGSSKVSLSQLDELYFRVAWSSFMAAQAQAEVGVTKRVSEVFTSPESPAKGR